MWSLRVLSRARQCTYSRLVALSVRNLNHLSHVYTLRNESNLATNLNTTRKMGMFSHGSEATNNDVKEM